MYIIAGLGNPTKQYENTRHNAGFCVIDYLSEKYNIPVKQAGYKALYGSGYIEGQKVILLKPQTYMNLSGESIRACMDFYKIDPEEELIVILSITKHTMMVVQSLHIGETHMFIILISAVIMQTVMEDQYV